MRGKFEIAGEIRDLIYTDKIGSAAEIKNKAWDESRKNDLSLEDYDYICSDCLMVYIIHCGAMGIVPVSGYDD